MQSATSAADSCLPSTLAARTGTATGVLGIISNFKSVLLAVGGHLVATWEHIVLSAVCTYYLIQFGFWTCIPPSLTAIFEPIVGTGCFHHLSFTAQASSFVSAMVSVDQVKKSQCFFNQCRLRITDRILNHKLCKMSLLFQFFRRHHFLQDLKLSQVK